jgi:hypothetical protein
MDLESTARELFATVGDFLNSILGGVVNLFNSFFSFLPENLRTGFGVVVFIVIGIIIYFLWPKD